MIEKRLIALLGREKQKFFLLVAASAAGGALIIVQAAYLARIIDGVFLQGMSASAAAGWLGILLAVMLLRSIMVWLQETLAHQLATAVKERLRQEMLAHLFNLGPLYTGRQATGELVNNISESVEKLEAYFTRFLPQLFMAIMVPALILLWVFPADIGSGILLLITAPLIPVFMILIGQAADKLNKKQWDKLQYLSAHFLDVLQGLMTLRIFGRSREQAQVIARMSGQFRSVTLKVLRVAFLSALVLELMATICTALVAVTVGLKLLYFRLEFVEALFVLLLAPEFYAPLRSLGTQFHAGMAGIAAADSIFALLAVPPEVPLGGAATVRLQQAEITVSNVYYAYEQGQRPALRGVSLHLASGRQTALVGMSGSGKSTLAWLLLKLMEPQQGEIWINGQDLRELGAAAWRDNVALVPQAPHMFCSTVAENICLGRAGASNEEIIAAASQAGAHEFIMNLPEGYQTVIGEGGHGLSGGEVKRLAIARAFLQNAPLLILDEATTGLDPYQEMLVDQALQKLKYGRTVLIIAHRLTTVCAADHIAVFEEGRITEQGSHEKLLARDGRYRQLVAAFRGGV